MPEMRRAFTNRDSERDRAVSSLVGNSVLVALTAILAATVAAFALGFAVQTLYLGGGGGGGGSPAPEAAFAVEYFQGNRTAVVTHVGGDVIDAEGLVVRRDREEIETAWPSPEVTAGDSTRIRPVESGDEVSVVWEHPEKSRTWVLHSERVGE
jgi:hypothetical protein